MSRIDVLIDRCGPLTRAAVLTDGRLSDLHIDHDQRPSLLGAVFLARVERIATALNAAFVDLGAGKSGLLAAADVRGFKDRTERIGTLLRTGQPVVVQVKAEAVGDKGPTVTMDVALPGRFLVHLPLGQGVTVSKRIGDAAARAQLARRIGDAAAGQGWIARSGAAGADSELLAIEADALAQLWKSIELTATGSCPRLLRAGPEAAVRILTETGAARPGTIRVDGPDLERDVAAWCAAQAPDLSDRIVRQPRLFEMHDLDSAIDSLLTPRVPLPGGGSLVIERTEALWAVDVNAGERGNAIEVNLEAARELARQLRLRNVGGIVVVDFINMKNRGDAERLLNGFAHAVDADPVQTQVYGLSKLGLVELTRARRGTALVDLLSGFDP